jgi:hypothetical protein
LQQKAPNWKAMCHAHPTLFTIALCDTQLHHIHEFVIPSEYMRRTANFGVPGTLSFQCRRAHGELQTTSSVRRYEWIQHSIKHCTLSKKQGTIDLLSLDKYRCWSMNQVNKLEKIYKEVCTLLYAGFLHRGSWEQFSGASNKLKGKSKQASNLQFSSHKERSLRL